MKLKTRYFLMSLTIILFYSCSQEEIPSPTTDSVELKFENTTKTDKESGSKRIYQTRILSTSPLQIESDELEVIQITHSVTNKVSYAIVEKALPKKKTTEYSKEEQGCENSIQQGYWYDGNDCFVYGTIVTGDNCQQLFIPADTSTQNLMNECGWSDIA
ncbi:MAG: hypothetical protein VX798_02825 [Bacteroidota bacterium]|nr:hypothetical protein [Bacteroidota bacterium]